MTTKTSSQYFSYVAQEDVFVATLTCWEALTFYTELSLPGEFTQGQRKGRMRAVLRTMGLEKVTNSKVIKLPERRHEAFGSSLSPTRAVS